MSRSRQRPRPNPEEPRQRDLFEVLYYSLGGRTRKLAETIAAELGVKAEDVRQRRRLVKDSYVFLGSGCYGGKPGRRLTQFIARNDFTGRRVALFGSSADGRSVHLKTLESLLKAKGALIAGSFHCRGQAFFFLNRGQPDSEDLGRAAAFARDLGPGTHTNAGQ